MDMDKERLEISPVPVDGPLEAPYSAAGVTKDNLPGFHSRTARAEAKRRYGAGMSSVLSTSTMQR